LGVAFAVMTLLIVVIAGIGASRVHAVDKNTEMIVHDRAPKIALAQTIENEVNRQSRALRTALIAKGGNDEAVYKAELSKIETSAPIVAKAMEQLHQIIQSEKGKEALAHVDRTRAVFREKEHHFLELLEANKPKEARAFLLSELISAQGPYLKAVEEFAQTQTASMEAFASDAAAQAREATVILWSLTAVASVLAIALGIVITRSVTGPIKEALQFSQAVAGGDLTKAVVVTGRDETSDLLRALNEMNASLLNIVGQVRESSDSIATGTTQIAQGNQDLSARTENQASSLQQTAASMEEITSTVKQSADNARQANQLATTATEVAAKGGAVVSEVVTTMDAISGSSKKITDIISVIDGIAFQTNILALNAAVEAARAGEQGRGFAVVAGEVRTLAQRSADAAKEIKSLISDSVAKVDSGARLVVDAGNTMKEIVAQVQRVSDLVGEITAATVEQSSGIEQINTAVTTLDQATQQNAALVEESAAAASSLRDQAAKLNEVVSTFKVAGNQERRTHAAVHVQPVNNGNVDAQRKVSPLRSARNPHAPAGKPAMTTETASRHKTGTDDEWAEF
jgi:methyl-accepting chemotaxis protein